jgi:hypothetical protein
MFVSPIATTMFVRPIATAMFVRPIATATFVSLLSVKLQSDIFVRMHEILVIYPVVFPTGSHFLHQ